jgi:hypothetical protein
MDPSHISKIIIYKEVNPMEIFLKVFLILNALQETFSLMKEILLTLKNYPRVGFNCTLFLIFGLIDFSPQYKQPSVCMSPAVISFGNFQSNYLH